MKRLSLVLFLLAVPARVMDDSQFHMANDYQEKLSICASYFDVCAQCVAAIDPKLKNILIESRDFSIQALVILGSKIGMSESVITSRMNIQNSSMASLMKDDCINVGSAQIRYAEMCRRVLYDPDSLY